MVSLLFINQKEKIFVTSLMDDHLEENLHSQREILLFRP